MPTNLPPEYFDAEERYKAAQTPEERVARLEELLSTIPKHKGTDHLRADLRRRLSKLREAASTKKSVSRHESAYHIGREGAGQVAVVGPPNVGKSSLVVALTNATPEVAQFPFTTWTPTPGMMQVENVQIQLIDTPPLSEEYVEPQLMDLIRRADFLLVMLDIQAYPLQQLEDVLALMAEQRIAPVEHRDQFAGRFATFKKMIFVVNKVDDVLWDEEFDVLCELVEPEWKLLPISVTEGRNLEGLRWHVFESMGIIRVYSKPPGREADTSTPFVMRRGSTVEEFAGKVHKDFLKDLKSARIWGSGVFEGQMVSRDHVLHDGDIVELRT